MATFSNFYVGYVNTGNVGPFRSSAGKTYMVYTQAGANDDWIGVWWCSGDPTSATWTLITTNSPQLGTVGPIGALSCHQIGDKIHVTGQDVSTSRKCLYARFDMASGTNGAWVDLGTSQYSKSVANPGATGDRTSDPDPYSCQVVDRASNSDLFVFFQGNEHADMGARYSNIVGKRSTDDGATWGVEFAVTTASGAVGFHDPSAVKTANNRIHIFFTDDAGNVYVSTLRATDTTVSTASPDNFEIDTGATSNWSADDPNVMRNAVAFDDGGTEKVKCAYENATPRGAVIEFDDADTPASFTDTEVTDTAISNLNGKSPHLAFVNDGADEYSLFIDSATSDIHYDKNDGTDVSEVTGTFDKVMAAAYDRSGKKIGFLYSTTADVFDFGEIDIAGALALLPTGLASGAVFGAATVAPGAVNLVPAGIAGGAATGAPTITATVDLQATGRASGLAFGAPTVAPGAVDLQPQPIGSGAAFGAAAVSTGPVDLQPAGLASSAAFGSPTLASSTSIEATALAPTLAFGGHTVAPGAVSLEPAGIASAAAFGVPSLDVGAVELQAAGIASGIAYGAAAVTAEVTLQATGLPAAGAFGSPELDPGVVELTVFGIAADAAFGGPVLGLHLEAAGLAGAAVFGGASLEVGAVALQPPGLDTGVAFGAPAVGLNLAALGLPSGIDFGAALLVPGPVALQPTGLAPLTAFGLASIGIVQSHGLAPPWRLAAILAEGRAAAPPAEGRLAGLPAEARATTLPAEDRSGVLAAEARAASIAAEARTTAILPSLDDKDP